MQRWLTAVGERRRRCRTPVTSQTTALNSTSRLRQQYPPSGNAGYAGKESGYRYVSTAVIFYMAVHQRRIVGNQYG